MAMNQSRTVELSNHENTNPVQNAGNVSSSPEADRKRYSTQYVPLHHAALKGNWDEAGELLQAYPTLINAPISKGGETALHLAALQGHHSFVANLLSMMEETDLEIKNAKGNTALCFAAAAGHQGIVVLMVAKYPNLPKIHGGNGITPLYMAVLQGYDEMAEYLYPLSDFQCWTEEDQIALLTTSIDYGSYGLAKKIVDEHKKLAMAKDCNDETPLHVLARKPLAFCCSSRQGLWDTISKTLTSYMKIKTHNKGAPCDPHMLLNCLWNCAISEEDIESAAQVQYISQLLFIAAESGNDDFLVELIRRYPDFLYEVNQSRHTIFHIAVLHRFAKVFNLMDEFGSVKDLVATYIDKDGNNILHLAAKLAPQNQLNSIPGATLQMQREILWYKQVEKLVRPTYTKMLNNASQTPDDLFLAEHENLMKEGEKFMKQTAKSCMLVTMLIATVVFTMAFTMPGGYNNNTGAPLLQNEKIFQVFPISEAVATLSSLTSILMFLSILTSRHSANDFLKWLPFWLVVGVSTLFVSIVALMVAFCTCILFYQHELVTIAVLLVSFASVPIMFVILKYPLLVTILRCTCRCIWLFRSDHRL